MFYSRPVFAALAVLATVPLGAKAPVFTPLPGESSTALIALPEPPKGLNVYSREYLPDLCERFDLNFFERSGWTSLDGKIGRTGFDNLFVKTRNGVVSDVLFVESKSGSSRLGDTQSGKQMSLDWIKNNLRRYIDSNPPESTKLHRQILALVEAGNYRAQLSYHDISAGKLVIERAKILPDGTRAILEGDANRRFSIPLEDSRWKTYAENLTESTRRFLSEHRTRFLQELPSPSRRACQSGSIREWSELNTDINRVLHRKTLADQPDFPVAKTSTTSGAAIKSTESPSSSRPTLSPGEELHTRFSVARPTSAVAGSAVAARAARANAATPTGARVGNAGGLAVSAYMLWSQRHEIAQTFSELNQHPDQLHPWLGTGATGSMAVSGLSFGAAEVAALSGRTAFSQAAQKAGMWAMVAYEGFAIFDYATGGSTPRQFWTSQAALAGGFAGGAAAGAVAGAAGGPFVEVTVPMCAIIGGIAGSMAGRSAADSWYEKLDAETKRRCDAAVYSHFGLTAL